MSIFKKEKRTRNEFLVIAKNMAQFMGVDYVLNTNPDNEDVPNDIADALRQYRSARKIALALLELKDESADSEDLRED